MALTLSQLLKKIMKIAQAIEGGLTGVSTIGLLQEALHKIDHKAPRPLLNQSGLIKKLKKTSGKNGTKSTKLYISLAAELLGSAAFYGLTGLGKKKNAVLRGGLLGAAAGLGAAFMSDKNENEFDELHGASHKSSTDDAKEKALTVALYTAGGLLAGGAIKKFDQKLSKKKLRRMLKLKKLKRKLA